MGVPRSRTVDAICAFLSTSVHCEHDVFVLIKSARRVSFAQLIKSARRQGFFARARTHAHTRAHTHTHTHTTHALRTHENQEHGRRVGVVMQRSIDSFFSPKGKTLATDEDDSLGLPPLAPVPVGTGASSSSSMGEGPSLLDAMAMEETINADAVAMTVSTAGTSEQTR